MSRKQSVASRLNAALRKAWPMGCMLSLVFMCWAFFEAVHLMLLLVAPDAQQLRSNDHQLRDVALILAATIYGGIRVMMTHPVIDDAYYDWLSLTPWNVTKPLPQGPVHLVWQDALFVGFLMLLVSYRPVVSPAAIPLAMLVAYLIVLTGAHKLTGPAWIVYAIGLGLALALRGLWWSPWAALVIVGFLAAFSQVALRVSLAQFPWERRLAMLRASVVRDNEKREDVTKRSNRSLPPETQFADIRRLWPLSALHVDRRERLLSRGDFVAISLLCGTWVYCATAGLPPDEELRMLARFLMLAIPFIAALARFAMYAGRHPSSLGFIGRVATGQWIMPSYDVVYLAPAATVVVGMATYILLANLGAALSVELSMTVTASLLVAFLGGPEKRRWQLTCPTRLTSKPIGSKTAIEI